MGFKRRLQLRNARRSAERELRDAARRRQRDEELLQALR